MSLTLEALLHSASTLSLELLAMIDLAPSDQVLDEDPVDVLSLNDDRFRPVSTTFDSPVHVSNLCPKYKRSVVLYGLGSGVHDLSWSSPGLVALLLRPLLFQLVGWSTLKPGMHLFPVCFYSKLQPKKHRR